MLTPHQRKIYDFVYRTIEATGQSPTLAEIRDHFKLKSHTGIHRVISILVRERLLRRIPHAGRGLELVGKEAPQDQTEIPLAGVISAGHPIEAILSYETIIVPRNMIGRGRTFALRVRGDSMIGEGILDNDFIIVESRQTAENGQTVVALLDNDATVKRFYQERGRIRLEAANPRYKPIIVKPPVRLQIQGIVVGVIRRYA